MALLLLLATSGVTVSRMSCLISGHSELSLGLADDCCPEEEHGGSSVEATCCDFDQAGTDRIDVLPGSQLEFISLPVIEAVSQPDARISAHLAPHWLESRPPLLSGLERLTLVRRFLI